MEAAKVADDAFGLGPAMIINHMIHVLRCFLNLPTMFLAREKVHPMVVCEGISLGKMEELWKRVKKSQTT